jgi:hypothetical protein
MLATIAVFTALSTAFVGYFMRPSQLMGLEATKPNDWLLPHFRDLKPHADKDLFIDLKWRCIRSGKLICQHFYT